MARSSGRRGSTERPSLARRIIAEIGANLRKGIKSLATPKGILALLPYVISVAAFIKASYVTTSFIVVFNEPISMQVTLIDDETGMAVAESMINDFEFFMITEGRDTVYVSEMNMNITEYDSRGDFDSYCNYIIPHQDNPNSGSVFPPFIVSAQTLSRSYAYDLRSGFVITPNSVLPLSGRLAPKRNAVSDEMLSTATGATNAENYEQRPMELILESGKPDIAFCISGTAFTSGGPRQRFVWTAVSLHGNLFAHYSTIKYGAPPVAPGGKGVKAREIRKLSLRSPDFDSGLRLFTTRKFLIF